MLSRISSNAIFRHHKAVYVLVAAIFLFLSMLFYCMYYLTVLPASRLPHTIDFNVSGEQKNLPVPAGGEVRQTFHSEQTIHGFSLKFLTGGVPVGGTVDVTLTDTDTGTVLFREKLEAAKLTDNQFWDFKLAAPHPFSGTGSYQISVTRNSVSAGLGEVALAVSSQKEDGGDCFVGGKPYAPHLIFRLSSGVNAFLIPLFIGFVVFIMAVLFIITLLCLSGRAKTEHLFLVSVLCAGIVYMFMMQPQSIPDEEAHFETVYRYSDDLLLLGHSDSSGAMLQRADDADLFGSLDTTANIYTTSKYYTVWKHLLDPLKDARLVKANGADIKVVPTVYLPAAVGMTLARLLHLGTFLMYYAGRLFNLLFYTLMIFLAIKILPFGKPLFAMIALLPMSVHQAASYSYDPVVMSFTFLFVSYCLFIAYGNKPVKWKNIGILCILAALLAPAKIVYVFICFLPFIIPKERLSSLHIPKFGKLIVGLCVASCAALSFWFVNYSILGGVAASSGHLTYTDQPGYTVSYLLQHPSNIPFLISNTFDHVEGILNTLLGGKLGWLNVPIPSLLSYASLILLVFSALKSESARPSLRRDDKYLIFGIILVTVVLVYASMLFTWTPIQNPPNTSAVTGVQGRYFLPVLPLVFLLLHNNRIVLKVKIDHYLFFSAWIVHMLIFRYVFAAMIASA